MGWSNGPKTWSELNARLSDGRRRVTSPRPGAESASDPAPASNAVGPTSSPERTVLLTDRQAGSGTPPPGRDGKPDAESVADGFDVPVLERHGRVVPIGKPGRVDNIPPIAESPVSPRSAGSTESHEWAGGRLADHPSARSSAPRSEAGLSSNTGSPSRTGQSTRVAVGESGWQPGRARVPQPESQPQSRLRRPQEPQPQQPPLKPLQQQPQPLQQRTQAKKEWDGGPRPDGGDAQAWARKRAPYEPTGTQAHPTKARETTETVPYAELHCHSNFSFLDGASHPEELVEEAVRLGLKALAITDHDGLYGVVRFAEAARAHGLPTVFGSELTLHAMGRADQRVGNPDPDGDHLVVLAADPIGYGRLARAIATSHLAAGEKGAPRLLVEQLAALGAGSTVPFHEALRRGPSPEQLVAGDTVLSALNVTHLHESMADAAALDEAICRHPAALAQVEMRARAERLGALPPNALGSPNFSNSSNSSLSRRELQYQLDREREVLAAAGITADGRFIPPGPGDLYRSLAALSAADSATGFSAQPYPPVNQIRAHSNNGGARSGIGGRDLGHWRILTGCRKGAVARALVNDGPRAAARQLDRLIDAFGQQHVVVELWDHGDPLDSVRNDAMAKLAANAGVDLIATNNVHYAHPSKRPLATALAAVRSRRSLDEVDGWLPAGSGAHLRSGAEQAKRFARYPGAVARAAELALECAFDLKLVAPNLPPYPCPDGLTEMGLLRRLTEDGAERRYGKRKGGPDGADSERVPRAYGQIDHELRLVAELGFAGYFLVVWDLVEFCRRSNIFCQGRGSAANSAVCYALGITNADAVSLGLLFERFLSPERDGPPDIDIDIESGRREEVIQYVYARYGRERAAQVANVITYRSRSAVRDMGKALGHSPGQLDAWGKVVDGWGRVAATAELPNHGIPKPVLDLATQVEDFPRHLGIHSGGMVICDRPVVEVCPVEWGRFTGRSNSSIHAVEGTDVDGRATNLPLRTVLQWDKEDCARAGLVKFDLLGLGMLSALHNGVDFIRSHHGVETELALIPQEDDVYDMICRADTIGVFQIESRAQMATLPRLRPRHFYDLVVEVALIRPGPIQGGSVHPYIRRRNGQEAVTYLHPLLERSLKKTLGIPLFQEQLMQMSIDIANFTASEADQLRQAMGSKRSTERMERLKQRLFDGMRANGVDDETALIIYDKLAAFANYGFPESHSVSFAYLVYASCWMKHHYPAAFCAALLNAQPMGFYSPQSLTADARRHGVTILGPDLNASSAGATLEWEPTERSGQQTSEQHSSPSTALQTSRLEDELAGKNTVEAGERSSNVTPLQANVNGVLPHFGDNELAGNNAGADDQPSNVTPFPVRANPARANDARDDGTLRSKRLDHRAPVDERGYPIYQPALRMGLADIRSIGGDLATRIVEERIHNGAYQDMGDLVRRIDPGQVVLEALATAGAFTKCFGLERRAALWAAGAAAQGRPGRLAGIVTGERAPNLPGMAAIEEAAADLWATGVTLGGYPTVHVREELRALGIRSSAELREVEHGTRVWVGGVVTHRQRPQTAGGTTFINLEDETGLVNVIVSKGAWARYRQIARGASALLIRGTLERTEAPAFNAAGSTPSPFEATAHEARPNFTVVGAREQQTQQTPSAAPSNQDPNRPCVINIVADKIDLLSMQIKPGKSRDFH
jgi:error-prone DNA polymerase